MNSLTFNEIELHPVPQNDGQIWLSSSEVAQVLDYKSADSVTKIFNRNVDEFTDSMTQVIDYSMDGQIDRPKNSIFKIRIFSLRGCHLIAMFARTPVAKEFRKWVLDVLDKEVGQNNHQTISQNPHLYLRDTIQAVAKGDRGMYKALYNRLYRKFQVTSYKELNDTQCIEAAEFIKSVQGEYIPRDKIEAPKPTFALADGQHYIVVKDGEPLYRYLLSSEVTDSCLKTMGINQDQFNSLKKDLAHFLKPHDPYLQITYPSAQRALSMMVGILTILEQHGLKMDEMYQKLDYVKMLLTNYHTRLSEAELHLSIVKSLVSTTTHPTVVSGQGVKFS